MKILYLSIIVVLYISLLLIQFKPIQADTASDILIQNIQVQPTIVKIGDVFTVNATLVNNSSNTVSVEYGACEAPFSITFDNHVHVSENKLNCTSQMVLQRLDPSEKIIVTSPYLNFIYKAVGNGNSSAVATFSYLKWDPTTQSNSEKTISKPFSFTIYDNNTNIQISNHGGPPFTFQKLSPLKQFKSGIAANDVKCEQGLQLVIKTEDNSPACVKHDTATKLIARGWSKVITSIENTNLNTLSENGCGQFHTAPGNQDNNKIPVLLMNSNSIGCTRLTFTIIYNYHNTPWPRIANFPSLGIVGNTNHVTHGDTFSVTPGKDFTNSFQIAVMPQTVDLANYPIGSNFTVTYVIKPLPNATGFYDHSIPKLACEIYPLVVGYAANQVNYSDFSYIDPLNPPCGSGPYKLTAVEISGMNYKQVELGSHP